MCSFRLVDRDYKLMKEVDRWRCVNGAQLCALAGFPSQRTCDRRLKILLEAGYITRKKILYGVPYLYFLTSKGQTLIHVQGAIKKVKIEQIVHDLEVVNTAVYLNKVKGIPYSDMTTEIELHRQDGFSNRKHRPDLIYSMEEKKTCVEVELTLKAKGRFLKNIEDNFMGYDMQLWIVPDKENKIATFLQDYQTKYINIEILELKEVQKHA